VRTYQWHHTGEDVVSTKVNGELVALTKWEFASQIGGCAVSHTKNGEPVLFVTQPGGKYHKLRFDQDFKVEEALETQTTLENVMDPHVALEIIALPQKKTRDGHGGRFVVAGLDGTLALLQQDQITWKLQVGFLHYPNFDRAASNANFDSLIVTSLASKEWTSMGMASTRF
jgi:hypothetical protein